MQFAVIFVVVFAVFVQIYVRPHGQNSKQNISTTNESIISSKNSTNVKQEKGSVARKNVTEKIKNEVVTENGVVKRIRNVLEDIKNVKDPIGETNIKFDIPGNRYINGKLEMKVVFLFGQANVTLDNFSYNESSTELRFTLTWKNHIVFMTTNDNLIALGNFTDVIKEKSQIRILFNGLQINGTALVGESKISRLKVITKIKSCMFNVARLLNNDALSIFLSNNLSNNFAHFLDDNVAMVSKILSPLIEAAINSNL